MYPLNFLMAVTSLGVTLFYVALNWMNPTRAGTRYQFYRNAFCVAVLFLSALQIVRAFAPLELQNTFLQLGVATVIFILVLWIKIFETIAERQPGVAAKTLYAALIFVAIGAMLLPGGGYWGEATFAKETMFNGDIFLRPEYGPPTPYRAVLTLSGVFGLGYLLVLGNITAQRRDRRIGRAMAITTIFG